MQKNTLKHFQVAQVQGHSQKFTIRGTTKGSWRRKSPVVSRGRIWKPLRTPTERWQNLTYGDGAGWHAPMPPPLASPLRKCSAAFPTSTGAHHWVVRRRPTIGPYQVRWRGNGPTMICKRTSHALSRVDYLREVRRSDILVTNTETSAKINQNTTILVFIC